MSDELDMHPDPLEIPSAEWLLHQLSEHGDDAGADFNDGEAVYGYFGWSITPVRNSASGKLIRNELEIWWEPAENDDLPRGVKPKRHLRRFLVQEITGQRGAATVEAP
jgi:hypothetical protein